MENFDKGVSPEDTRESTEDDVGSGGTTRRKLIAGAAAATAVGALGSQIPLAAAHNRHPFHGHPAPRGSYRIDLDCHFIPTPYRELLESHKVLTVPWSVDAHIQFMDKWGIQKSVVSVPQPFDFGNAEETKATARAVNESGADLLEEHGDRFALHTILPLPDVKASIEELTYSRDVLGLDGGVLLFTNYNNVYLGDPSFDALLEELNKRKMMVWVHPVIPVKEPIGPFPGAVLEYPFETTRAATNMIYHNIPQRFPNIKWQFSHAGGALPYVLLRLAFYEGLGIPPLDLPSTPAGPFNSAETFYYTTAIGFSEEDLLSLNNLTGPPKIIFGTDFPFTNWFYADDSRTRAPWLSDLLPANGDPIPVLSRLFSRQDRITIERDNALSIYPKLLQQS